MVASSCLRTWAFMDRGKPTPMLAPMMNARGYRLSQATLGKNLVM